MLPKRSYLLNAAYSWIADNDMTPYLLVDADQAGTIIPREFVKDGQIVLDISMSAVRNLIMDKSGVSFGARFGGKPMEVYVPIQAALALYAQENGDGFVFPDEEFPEEAPEPTPPTPPKKGFTLKVVK
ncbi:hypothetical protein MSP8886_01639 [Marinomonas spartinae]|uniref:Stringent starvation protein B n=1 Tax=Marinomonas spartinae TaxID=1792290 RepID=A0A1A8TDS0_9GAMM|nr:ClpXP protease specificity-enhancing factor SspB [Marinomonas spartinae]SBS29920.1 hypothetical protein MSP8886_01639 [Marinomonas spartinae]